MSSLNFSKRVCKPMISSSRSFTYGQFAAHLADSVDAGINFEARKAREVLFYKFPSGLQVINRICLRFRSQVAKLVNFSRK